MAPPAVLGMSQVRAAFLDDLSSPEEAEARTATQSGHSDPIWGPQRSRSGRRSQASNGRWRQGRHSCRDSLDVIRLGTAATPLNMHN